MRHGSLFSGIGGFDLASEWMGWENVFHCEWNEFGQKVLKYYWPKAISYNDITKTDFSIHRGEIDIITGGFPCQPYSMAGKRLGKEDSRHLWPEMLRAIREIQPTWVVGENVRGLTNWNGGLVFDEVQADLEAEGYEVTPFLLPACAVNAPHRRDRIWFVAYSNNTRNSTLSSGDNRIRKEESEERKFSQYESSRLCFKGDATNTSSIGLCKHGEGQRLLFETLGASVGMGKENATDSKLEGLQGCTDSREIRSEEREMGREGDKLATQFTSISNESNVTDSNSIGHECREERERSERWTQSNDKQFKRRNKLPGADFKMFPSVSPICDGNDGVSDRLDSITFSKWRNESIKAGGNAIVPQVVHQIFKAIQKYNDLEK